MKRLILAALMLALLAACGAARPTAAPATSTTQPTVAATSTPQPPTTTPEPPVLPTAVAGELTVDPSIDLGPISPYLFGTNYGPMQAVVAERMPDVESAGVTA